MMISENQNENWKVKRRPMRELDDKMGVNDEEEDKKNKNYFPKFSCA